MIHLEPTSCTFIRVRSFFVALSAAFLLLAHAHAIEERAIALAENLQNGPRINVAINGAQSTAVLDTGATIPLLDAQMVVSERNAIQTEQTAMIRGLGGEKGFRISRLDDLKIGSESWSNIRVALNPEPTYPVHINVMPTALFDARVVDFDFYKRRVSFYDSKPKQVRWGRRSVLRYSEVQGLKFIRVRLNGTNGFALLDTGATVSFVNPAFVERAKGVHQGARTKPLRGSDLSNIDASYAKFSRFQIGEFRVNQAEFPVVETDLFKGLGFADQPVMVLGMDLLQQFRLQIDRRTETVILTHLPVAWRGSS